ncbi:MAG TPA: TIGR03668 family PPOX class F420-dependent oxidoreductase [Gaiellaceae bacterium]|nr:TIGR03668 family PPOX class F420-dependent oxidoreductase [Gaiellaceae bacterium]
MRRRVAAARVARLASLDPAGRLHVVPICFALDGETLVSAVDAKPKASTRPQRLVNVRASPEVALLVDEYDEDWSRLWWVRLRGRARVVEEEPEREDALALLAAKYPQYRDEPPPGPAIVVELTEWRGWAAVP